MTYLLSGLGPLYGGGFVPAFLQLVCFYYLVGALLHWGVPAVFPVQGIQQSERKRGAVLRDAFYSIGPLTVKAGIWVLVEKLHAAGLTLTYEGPVKSSLEVVYCLVVVCCLDYLHDSWFYLTHRLLHWAPLYRHVHYIHHKSSVPSAFTGYSFHVIEAVIVFANEVFVCWLLPHHIGLHRVYHLLTTMIHEGGHAGYEMAPFIPTLEGVVALALHGHKAYVPALNTVQHHDLHHRYPNRHFSLYFTHWDRWLGTLHPTYEAGLFKYFSDGSSREPASPKDRGTDSHSSEDECLSDGSATVPEQQAARGTAAQQLLGEQIQDGSSRRRVRT